MLLYLSHVHCLEEGAPFPLHTGPHTAPPTAQPPCDGPHCFQVAWPAGLDAELKNLLRAFARSFPGV